MYFNNRALRIFAKTEELLKSESRFIVVKNHEEKELLINLDQVLWISKENYDLDDF